MMQIPIGEAVLGQKLAADALDARGMVLLAKGTVLTEMHLRLLIKRGVRELALDDGAALHEAGGEQAGPESGIPVSEASGGPAAAGTGAARSAHDREREQIVEIFAQVRGDELMEIVLELALERVAASLDARPG